MILLFSLLASSVLHNSYSYPQMEDVKTYENYKLYAVYGAENRIRELVNSMRRSDEPYEHNAKGSTAHMLIPPHLVTLFEDMVYYLGLRAKVEIEDFSETIRSEKATGRAKFSWKAYYDVDAIYHFLQNTSGSYPDWTEVIVAGQSYEGRNLLGIRINTPSPVTNETEGKNKPIVFIESGIHAREWITPAATTYFINQLLTSNDPNITNLRDQFDWRIFPTVNPDGYHHSYTKDRMWRKTRSRSSLFCYGADPNRNWDYNWLLYGASSNPCNYQTYGGSKPFSEIETRSLSEYLSGISEDLLAYVAFHSDARMLLVPFSDSTEHHDNYDDLIQIGKKSLQYGQQVNGEEYRGPATAAEILYKASGGSMDWVRDTLGTPLVYTFELRGTAFHWPPDRIHEQGDEYTQMMLGLFEEAKKLNYY